MTCSAGSSEVLVRSLLLTEPEPELEQPCCRRCSNRQEAAAVRVGPTPSHRPLDPYRATFVPPSRPHGQNPARHRPLLGGKLHHRTTCEDSFSRTPSRPSRTPGSPTAHNTTSTETSDALPKSPHDLQRQREQPRSRNADCMAGLDKSLGSFSERVHSHIISLMGFRHPHVARLRITLDQYVEALAQSFTIALTLKHAFCAFRTAVREAALFDVLSKCKQRILISRAHLRQCQQMLAQEAEVKSSAVAACNLAETRQAIVSSNALQLLLRRNTLTSFEDLLTFFRAWKGFVFVRKPH